MCLHARAPRCVHSGLSFARSRARSLHSLHCGAVWRLTMGRVAQTSWPPPPACRFAPRRFAPGRFHRHIAASHLVTSHLAALPQLVVRCIPSRAVSHHTSTAGAGQSLCSRCAAASAASISSFVTSAGSLGEASLPAVRHIFTAAGPRGGVSRLRCIGLSFRSLLAALKASACPPIPRTHSCAGDGGCVGIVIAAVLVLPLHVRLSLHLHRPFVPMVVLSGRP